MKNTKKQDFTSSQNDKISVFVSENKSIALKIHDVGDLPPPPENVHSNINKNPFFVVLHGDKADILLEAKTYPCLLPNGEKHHLFIQPEPELDNVYSYYISVN